MIKPINDFVSRFHLSITLNKNLILKRENRFYIVDKNLKKLIPAEFLCAGIYLGKTQNGDFLPSFNLLRIIAEKQANKVFIDRKTAWLFICGRDIFKKGILKAIGSKCKGDYTLVLNEYGECLGFGKIETNLDNGKEEVAIKNILDIGDFLRRERQRKYR